MAAITLSSARSGDVTIRLIERRTSDFVVVYDSPQLAVFQGWTTDRAHATRIFDRAVEIAEFGLRHPAWRKPATSRTIHINGE
jgi:hypothetical protein